MRKVKDSGIEWIGDIPESWVSARIKDIAANEPYSIVDGPFGSAISTSDYKDSGVPLIRIVNLNQCELRTDNLVYITEEHASKISRSSFYKGDIIFAKTGATVGKCAYNTNVEYGILSSSCVKIRIDESFYRKYYYYFFSTIQFNEALRMACNGTTRDTINLNPLSCLFCLIPPLPEQLAISAYLDRQCALIDSVTEKTKASIEEYKKLRQAVITQAVTKGVRGDRPMKEVENGFVDHIPNNWTYQKVKNFIAMPVIDGPHESPELYDDGIPYISATAIVDSKIDFSLMRGYISAEYCDECDKRYKPQINDILLIKLGASTGQVAIVDTDRRFNIWVPLAAIRCDDSVVPKFIYYSFQSEYLLRQMELSWTYGTQQTLGVKTIEQLRFVLPIIDEQQEIAAYLDKKCAEIDALIVKKETFLTELESYKKSLIYEYVTGKKEVPLA